MIVIKKFHICLAAILLSVAVCDLRKKPKLYTRKFWGALPSTDLRPLSTPVPYVVIHHTEKPAACYNTTDCSRAMRSMQNYHNSLDWGDIAYNFCVGSEGGAYEGRGWNIIGTHALRANNFSIGIALIGDWSAKLPPAIQLKTTKKLISRGVKKGIISPTYKLVGHKQVTASACPGDALHRHISTWHHFSKGQHEF